MITIVLLMHLNVLSSQKQEFETFYNPNKILF